MNKIQKFVIGILASFIIVLGTITSVVSYFTYKEYRKDIKSGITNATTEHNIISDWWNYIFGLTNRNKNVIIDKESNIYRLKNGGFSYAKKYVDTSVYKDYLVNFNSFLQTKNIKFQYVLTAESGDERLGQLPDGIKTNYCEQTSNELMQMLEECGIDYFDCYEYLRNSNKDYYSFFYKTDHHWNDYAGLYLAQEISKDLNNKYNFELNESILDLENYDVRRYENLFLGSIGKKITLGAASPENFELLLPKFETSYHFYDDSFINNNGDYETALIDHDCFIYSYYRANPYGSYLYADQPILHVHNNNCSNGKRLLVFKDSKANVVNIHLTSVFEYVDIIDPRHYYTNVFNYISETNPDMVLFMYSPFNGKEFYDFK